MTTRIWVRAGLGTATIAALVLAIAVGITAEEKPPASAPRIRAGDRLYVATSDLLPNYPVKGQYLVESTGTIVLGPMYGRAKVQGLTVEEAEDTVRSQLAKYIRDPNVSLTWYDAASHGDSGLEQRLATLERKVAELDAALQKLRQP